MAYGDFKDLPIRTASDKILRDKVFSIAIYPKYDGFDILIYDTQESFFNSPEIF